VQEKILFSFFYTRCKDKVPHLSNFFFVEFVLGTKKNAASKQFLFFLFFLLQCDSTKCCT